LSELARPRAEPRVGPLGSGLWSEIGPASGTSPSAQGDGSAGRGRCVDGPAVAPSADPRCFGGLPVSGRPGDARCAGATPQEVHLGAGLRSEADTSSAQDRPPVGSGPAWGRRAQLVPPLRSTPPAPSARAVWSRRARQRWSGPNSCVCPAQPSFPVGGDVSCCPHSQKRHHLSHRRSLRRPERASAGRHVCARTRGSPPLGSATKTFRRPRSPGLEASASHPPGPAQNYRPPGFTFLSQSSRAPTAS
jgi:hypothetical protein